VAGRTPDAMPLTIGPGVVAGVRRPGLACQSGQTLLQLRGVWLATRYIDMIDPATSMQLASGPTWRLCLMMVFIDSMLLSLMIDPATPMQLASGPTRR
jgi:hypothetical protein